MKCNNKIFLQFFSPFKKNMSLRNQKLTKAQEQKLLMERLQNENSHLKSKMFDAIVEIKNLRNEVNSKPKRNTKKTQEQIVYQLPQLPQPTQQPQKNTRFTKNPSKVYEHEEFLQHLAQLQANQNSKFKI